MKTLYKRPLIFVLVRIRNYYADKAAAELATAGCTGDYLDAIAKQSAWSGRLNRISHH